MNGTLAGNQGVYIYEGSTLIGQAAIDTSTGTWTYQLDGLMTGTTHTYTARVTDSAGNIGALSNPFAISVDLQVTVNSQTTLDTTPVVTGYTGFRLEAGEYVQVTINGTTYTSQTGAVVVDPLNYTWYVQIPDNGALKVGTYDVAAVVRQSDGTVIAQDSTFNELTVAPTPAVTFGGVGDAENKGTAITLGANGQWEIFTNQVVFNGAGTNGATLGNYTTTTLTPSTTARSGLNRTQTATFVDIDRNGTMDIVGEDNAYVDGQQAWIFDGQTYKAVQIGLYDTTTGNNRYGTTNNVGANIYGSYSGVVIYDANGDGLPDIAYGARTTGDAESTGGFDSQFVVNRDGTLNGFVKKGDYVYTATTGSTNSGNSGPAKEVSGIDLNNDGTIDIVHHGYSGSNKVGSATSSNAYRLVVVSNDGAGGLQTTEIINNLFYNQTGTTANGPSMTWADFNGDGFMDLFLGATYAGNHANSQIYFNDGQGHLMSTAVTGIGTAIGAYSMGDSVVGGASLAIDWNGDGRMDIVEAPQLGATGTVNLYMNNTSATGVNFTTSMLQANSTFGTGSGLSVGGTVASGRSVTGMVNLDLDWDGAQDLLIFTTGGNTTYVHNTNVIAEGTSLHLRIVDQNGINAFYGNTVELVNSHGVVVATQVINLQSGNQTSNSTGIVDFYGLDPNETYSAVLLRNVGGVSSDVGGVATASTGINGAGTANVIENVNDGWSNLTPGEANHAYVLTAASGTGTVDAYSGRAGGGGDIIGTGYNDTFFAQAGTAVYDGAGGTTTVSGVQAWTDTGGMDIVDYKLAGSTPLTIDLYLTGAQYTGYNTATFRNIEGIAGGAGNDRFTNGTGDDQFEGRGGNDSFNLVHSGHDTLLYKVLNAADATGGNGTDTVDHFTVGTWEATPDSSRLDLTDLLVGYTPGNGAKYINGVATIDASDHVTDYLKVTTDGGNTTVWVDRDGAGGQFSSTALVVLNGVQTDLATLLANHQIV